MERGGAICASLLFHLLLLLVLGSSSNFVMTLGEQSRLDVIFWVSPSPVSPQGAPESPLRVSARTADRQVAAAVTPKGAAIAPAPKGALPGRAKLPRLPMGVLQNQHPASPPPAGLAVIDTPADATLLLPPATTTPHSPPVKPERLAASREQTVELAARGAADRHEPAQRPVPPLPVPVRLGAFLEEGLTAATESAGGSENPAAAATTRERSEAVAAAASKPSAAVERGEESPRGASRAHSAGTVSRPQHPATEQSETPAEKPHEPRGIVATSLQGDLKMIISGDSNIRLLVIFREYPRSRRDRPLTRSEARREQRIQPLMGRADQDTREAVVETARDGIYTFSAEPERGDKAKANFTLKLFEAGRRERIAQIGSRTISGRTVIARVLMRDGILWDDESAFTGSIEDSESTTKFNANTGLYWKEYHH